jgi:hypothetical protein
VNVDITPVQRNRRQSRRAILYIMVFVVILYRSKKNSDSHDRTVYLPKSPASSCMIDSYLNATPHSPGLLSTSLSGPLGAHDEIDDMELKVTYSILETFVLVGQSYL